MTDIVLAFVTGITTGGLSCMAVQGGLLATSVARQLEQDIMQQGVAAAASRKTKARRVSAAESRTLAATVDADRSKATPTQMSLPIVLFLAAKLVAYTILGFLLGLAGALLQLTPLTRAILQLAIGVFMIGNALRMLNIHPLFRYFNLAPPQAVTRFIRRRAKQNADVVTPLFLGILTVLIPCGVTQAMMALALGTGSALQGAAIMFAFVLGTTPVFFALAYFAMRLGAALEKRFTLAAATVLLVLGLLSVWTAMQLTGFTLPSTTTATAPQTANSTLAASDAVTSSLSQDMQTLTINVKASGYEPTLLRAKADQPLKLALVTNKTYSCARSFVIPALNMERVLPATGTEWFSIPAQKAGTALKFTCSMGMYTGIIQFTD